MPMTAMRSMGKIAVDWAVRCFGYDHVYDVPIRSLRLAEEAVEMAQACGVNEEKMHELIKVVYSRPRGDREQEMGGVLLTAVVLCYAIGIDAEETFEAEVRRVLTKDAAYFAKRNEEKLRLGLK